jgi:hypothetical protein
MLLTIATQGDLIMERKLIAILAGMSLAALGGCTSDQTAGAPEAASAPSMSEVSNAASTAGTATATPEGEASRAFIDPVTGELRAPTAAELAAMQPSESNEPAVKQQAPPPEKTVLPDGTVMMDLRNQPQAEEKVCVQADGSIRPCPASK